MFLDTCWAGHWKINLSMLAGEQTVLHDLVWHFSTAGFLLLIKWHKCRYWYICNKLVQSELPPQFAGFVIYHTVNWKIVAFCTHSWTMIGISHYCITVCRKEESLRIDQKWKDLYAQRQTWGHQVKEQTAGVHKHTQRESTQIKLLWCVTVTHPSCLAVVKVSGRSFFSIYYAATTDHLLYSP